jgi:hypothetical protein
MTEIKNISFSPPDITDAEIEEVIQALNQVGLQPDQGQNYLSKR